MYRAERETLELTHGGEDDFKNQWGLAAIRADRAYAHLELAHGVGTDPGSGQTVGLIDTGIDTGHPMFAGKTVSEHFFDSVDDEDGGEISHGTAVAGVIVGRPSDSFIAEVNAPRGVARGADVAMFAINAGLGTFKYVPVSLQDLDSDDGKWASWLDHVIGWNGGTIDFVNMSVGYKGIIDQYTEQELRDNFGAAIGALAQTGTADKTIFVWGAGNANGRPCDGQDFTDNPDLCTNRNMDGEGKVNARSVWVLAGLPVRIPELRGHLLSVVSVAPDTDDDGDYEITSISNRCGIAADWCIAAPGQSVRVAYFGPHPDDNSPGARGVRDLDGTSLAAPMVTGGLVVLKDFFRDQLSNTDLASRLLATANSEGIYSDSSIYGHGLMDLGAATEPVGVANVVLGDTVDGSGSPLVEARFAPGGALGNAFARALDGVEIVAFDALGAPFWIPLDGLAGGAPQHSLTARMGTFMAPVRAERGGYGFWPGFMGEDMPSSAHRMHLGLLQTSHFGVDIGHLSLAERALTFGTAKREGLSIAALSTAGLDGMAPVSGAVLSWRPQDAPLVLRGGFLTERETLLGSRSAGAFGRVSGSAWFAGIGGGTTVGVWQFDAAMEIGATTRRHDPAARDGMFDRMSPLVTSAFALRAESNLANGDSLSFSLAQPIRVEGGHARLTVPVGRTREGRVLHRSLAANLEPGGRQLDFTAGWRRFLPGGGELRLGGGVVRQPGHVASMGTDRFLLAGWRYGF